MIATTPSGCRTECTSTLDEAFSVKAPLTRCGIPQANSTTSCPRDTSLRASESTLPCSAVMIAANSCLRAFSNSRKANRIWVRWAREVSRHCGKVTEAASTTAAMSASEASAS